MTNAASYTIWKNGTKHEWLVRDADGETVARSGLIFSSYAAAKRAMMKELAA